MITGINHITFSVAEVEASLRFYEQTIGMTVVAKWSGGAYLLAGDLWLALVGDQRTRTAALPEHSHIAFTVSKADFASLSRRIIESGATIWQDNVTEGDSLYFLDPSGHKLEIHASDRRAQRLLQGHVLRDHRRAVSGAVKKALASRRGAVPLVDI